MNCRCSINLHGNFCGLQVIDVSLMLMSAQMDFASMEDHVSMELVLLIHVCKWFLLLVFPFLHVYITSQRFFHHDYAYSCTPGWEGENCEVNINECLSSPCKNNGTCTDGDNSYTCICTDRWAGQDCATDIDECLSNPCLRRGICMNRNDSAGYV